MKDGYIEIEGGRVTYNSTHALLLCTENRFPDHVFVAGAITCYCPKWDHKGNLSCPVNGSLDIEQNNRLRVYKSIVLRFNKKRAAMGKLQCWSTDIGGVGSRSDCLPLHR